MGDIQKFSVSISFTISIEIICVIQIRNKTYKLFIYSSNIYPVIDPIEPISLYNICNVILTTYMLDSAPEHSYNAEKSFITAMDTEIDSRYGKWFKPSENGKSKVECADSFDLNLNTI